MTRKSLGCLVAIIFALCFFPLLAHPQEGTPSIHQRASACFEDNNSTFPDEPANCEDVCSTCHGGGYAAATEKIAGQTENPDGTRTDEAFPGLYSSVSGTAEDDWSNLPTEHQKCRLCHTDYTQTEGNHPIFVDASQIPEEGELKGFNGLILCATCHNPHQDSMSLLRIANTGSRLCLTCHAI